MAKAGLRDNIAALKRAMTIWQEYAPKYWTFSMIGRVFQRVSAYFSLTMSALLLDEISGARDEKRLIIFACLTVIGGFIFSVLSRAAKMKENILDSQNYYRYFQIMFDANCRLQYEHLECPDVRLLSEKIEANIRTIYGGLMNVLYIVPYIADALTEIILSLSLTVAALFATAECKFTGVLGFINSSWPILIMFLIVGAFSALTARLRVARKKRENEALPEVSLMSRRYMGP